MAVTIKGIRVDDVQIEPDPERGAYKLKQSTYCLIGSTGKVLAKQNLGGYGSLPFTASPATQAALDAFMAAYTNDVQSLLGLLE